MLEFAPLPPFRPLRIYAIDPQLATFPGNRTSIDLDYEPLDPGPEGDRVVVVDYDGKNGCYYQACDLEDPAVLMQGGLPHSEADPQFHQQMVYAVAMRTIRSFDRALGRRIQLYEGSSRPKLKLIPHAFMGANAFYDPALHAVMFGYFRADPESPGANLPSQIIFTCLSHDIIAHEVTHAMINRLRPHFLEPTNPDLLAFHEGFSDLVALFQHFNHPVTLRALIEQARGDVGSASILSQIAVQFGQSTRSGAALRSALRAPDAVLTPSVREPHARGGILLAAVFDAFKAAYQNAATPLIRLATGGSGVLPAGELHPVLVDELVKLAAQIADATLTMIIRAFDYMPPMDLSFGDFLRAVVTSDFNIAPEDRWGLRVAMIEAFRARAIYPEGVVSLSLESLLWPEEDRHLPPIDLSKAVEWFHYETIYSGVDPDRRRERKRKGSDTLKRDTDYEESQARAAQAIWTFADSPSGRRQLRLHPTLTVSVRGFHRVARVSGDGRVLNEIVLRIEQEDKSAGENGRLGGLALRGGCTVIAAADGRIRYIVGKALPDLALPPGDAGASRLAAIEDYVTECDLADPRSTYRDPAKDQTRMIARASLRGLHAGDC